MNGTEPYKPLAKEQVDLSMRLTQQAQRLVESDSEPGHCAGFQRIGFTFVLGIARAWQPGPDAIGVYNLMRDLGHTLPPGARAEVGDLLVWLVGHGPHGHIASRVIGNRVAQNSTWNYNQTGDPRGFRPLADLDPNYHVIRLWRP